MGFACVPELECYLEHSEPSCTRLVRTTAKLLAPGGQDQWSAHDEFVIFVTDREKRCNLVDYHHTRFNIVFHDSWNTLIKAVMSDISDSWFLEGARALELVRKLLTSPLWRVSEGKSIHIADIGSYYSSMLFMMESCLDNENEMQKFITGECVPELFHGRIRKDMVCCSLVNLMHQTVIKMIILGQ